MAIKPRKPTNPFGHIAFGKDGSVTERISRLSEDKEEQEKHFMECKEEKKAECFHCQIYKLAHGLLSGDYSKEPEEEDSSDREVKKRKKDGEKIKGEEGEEGKEEVMLR